MITNAYTVKGMTCAHCVQAVTAELSALPQVADVGIDLANGIVTISSESPVDVDVLRDAIDEAGYELVS
jgi:copper chaperone CopZ